MKNVTRKYYSKDGTLIVKHYHYEKKYSYKDGHSRRGYVLVNKRGQINKKNLNNYINKINSNPNFDDLDKRANIADLKAYVKNRAKNKTKLTTTGFEGHLKSDKLDRMLSNLGTSVEDVSSQYGFNEESLRNTDNWEYRGNTGYYHDGEDTYSIEWTYTGSIFKKV